MGRTDALLLWNDGFMNSNRTRNMRQQNDFQSNHPHLCVSGMLHARILFMWLTCLCSVHVACCIITLSYWIICVMLPSNYIYHYVSIPQPFSLCSFIPRFLLREAKFLPRCGEGARRKAVKRPCDLDPMGFTVEVRLPESNLFPEKMPWNERKIICFRSRIFEKVLCWCFRVGVFKL